MTIKELCYALQKISETEGDLEIVGYDLVDIKQVEVDKITDWDGYSEKVIRLC